MKRKPNLRRSFRDYLRERRSNPQFSEFAHQMLSLRRRSSGVLPKNLDVDQVLADAWSLLFQIDEARLAGVRLSISTLCITSEMPVIVAVRCLRVLTELELVMRRRDREKHGRICIELTPLGRSMLDQLCRAE